MIQISLDEAYVFDLLSIYQIKVDKNTNDKSKIIIENFRLLSEEISKQIGSNKFNEILSSNEYLELKSANTLVFDLVDRAHESELSKMTADANYIRYLKKVELQKKFFDSNMREVKLGNNIKSYHQSGKLGDFIHSLVVCKFNYIKYGIRANLYISVKGEMFETGLEYTYNELKDVLITQEWLNDFQIYNGETIDIDFTKVRKSDYLYKTNWLEIYFKEFCDGLMPPSDFKWIEVPKDSKYENSIIINRSLNHDYTKNNEYERILSKHKDVDRYFICFEENQYHNFPYKDKCKLLKVDNLYEFFEKINSCKLYVGNLSAPTAIATSMNVPRLIELSSISPRDLDNVHYLRDTEYYSNVSFF